MNGNQVPKSVEVTQEAMDAGAEVRGSIRRIFSEAA
jgi:hypothetical protein